MFSKYIMIVLLTSILLVSCTDSDSKEEQSFLNYSRQGELNTDFGMSHPPFSHQKGITFTIEHLKNLNVDRIRLSTDWATRQPTKDEFQWAGLDTRVRALGENDISLLLTIGIKAADWACTDIKDEFSCIYKDKEDFRKFIAELAKRYSNQIDKIQFGNEWDTEYHFIGTAEQFTDYSNIAYEEFKKYSPETIFVLGGMTAGVPGVRIGCEEGLSGFNGPVYKSTCGKLITEEMGEELCQSEEWLNSIAQSKYVLENAKYDMVDLHLYDHIYNWDVLYNKMKNLVGVPVIVTEFGVQEGGFEGCPMDKSKHADYVYEAMKKMNELKVPEAYYFNLVDGSTGPHDKSALIKAVIYKEKPAYYAFKEFNKK